MNETKRVLNRKASERYYEAYRHHLRDTDAFEQLACVGRLDRIVAAASAVPTAAIQQIPGFHLRRRYPVKPQRQGDFVSYGWVARIAGINSIREVMIYSDRQAKWLAPAKIIVIARDALGLQFPDMCSIFELLTEPQIIDVELACDFATDSIVDVKFVEKHALFGKSRPRNVGTNPLYSSYGRRVGTKFVRSYFKPELNCQRVEFSFHLRDLARFGIKDIFNLHKLGVVLPRHIWFARLSPQKLQQKLYRDGFSIEKQQAILCEAEKLEGNLCQTLKYLRRTARLKNTRRLLVPLDDINRVVLAAISKWAAEWAESYPTQKLTRPPTAHPIVE